MDKYEYKVRAEEIKSLIQKRDYAQAAEIADTIDWRRIKSVMMLCTISDLYKINRRYEDARDMLLLAYERRPGGRNICYSLCELCIKTGDLVQAMEFYKEFVNVAPRDPGRYILQYKLYEDQDVSLEERIEVLEELKKHDYREKWAYELAYLYHRVGLATRCVEECDEMILWFGDGDYVIKAMELKMLHQPLTPEQQEKYDHRFDEKSVDNADTEDGQTDADGETAGGVSEGDADGVAESPDDGSVTGDTVVYEPVRTGMISGPEGGEESVYNEDTNGEGAYEEGSYEEGSYEKGSYEEGSYEEGSYGEGAYEGNAYENETAGENAYGNGARGKDATVPEDMDIQVKIMDVGQYNTINLQKELAHGLKQLLAQDGQEELVGLQHKYGQSAESGTKQYENIDTESLDPLEIDEIDEEDMEPEEEEMEDSEVFFGETGEIVLDKLRFREKYERHVPEGESAEDSTEESFEEEEPQEESFGEEELQEESFEEEELQEVDLREDYVRDDRNSYDHDMMTEVTQAQPPREMADVLSQEPDGQIRIVVPEATPVEKQITGQMNIQDVLTEWERMKKENEEKRKEEVRQRVLQHTGNMFTEFEASVRDGLLEKLEKGDDSRISETVLPETKALIGKAEDADDGVEELADEPDDIVADVEDLDAEQDDIAEGAEEIAQVLGTTEDEAEEIVEILGTDEGETQELAEEIAEADTEAEEIMEAGEIAEADSEDEMEAEEIAETDTDGETGTEEPTQEDEATDASEETDTGKKALTDDGAGEVEPAAGEGRPRVRSMTREEREHFGDYIRSRSTREQIVQAIDNISLAAYTGNVIITGEVDVDTLPLAKKIIREVQSSDSNFSGQVAKISGNGLNQKDIEGTLEKLQNGALIIQKASDMEEQTVAELYKALQKENLGIVVLMQDDTKSMNRFVEKNPKLLDVFTSRIDVKALSNDMLVEFGKKYAKEQEYSIDAFGVLALHNRIEKRQTIDHAVTMDEVKKIVDEAIRHANRRTLGHFFDILISKRYDEEDMIIVTEKDFQ